MTLSNYIFAKFQLQFIETLLGHFQIVSLQKKLTFLLTQFILLTLESKQYPLTLAWVLACANSLDELRF